MNPSERIDKQIAELTDWRGQMVARLRKLIREADPDITEEWKWDTAVWSHQGTWEHLTGRKRRIKMGRIVVTEFVSLDGVMEAPGGGEDFKHAGWTFEIDRGKEGDQFKLDETLDAEALLLGRVTYEGFAAAWPSREGEFADKFNSMPKYVVSSTLEEAKWNNSTVIKGDVADEVAKLKRELDGDI